MIAKPIALLALASLVPLFMGCHTAPPTLDDVLRDPTPAMSRVLIRPEHHRLQIVLTTFPSESPDAPPCTTSFRAGAEYFYPASAIKLLGAIAACEMSDEIDAASPAESARTLSALDAPLAFEPLFEGQTRYDIDPSNITGAHVTLRHELRKLFLVSDNPAYNRLYEFVGQDDLNLRMRRAGLASVRLCHRLSEARTPDQNRRTPRVTIHLPEGDAAIPDRTGTLDLAVPHMPGLDVGVAYLRAGGERCDRAMNFGDKNFVSILDLHRALLLLVRPGALPELPGYQLAPHTRDTLLSIMREYPGDSANPVYNRAEYPDDYGKFFLTGLLRLAPRDDFRIVNKVGQAYGFTIDNAYIEHLPSGYAFCLTAVLYTNEDGVLNDDKYEYEQTAFPFLADLAEHAARAVLKDTTPGSGPGVVK